MAGCGAKVPFEDDDAGSGSDLPQRCDAGCDRFVSCQPELFEDFFASHAVCAEDCEWRFGSSAECEQDSRDYSQCTLQLECSDWVALVNDGPQATECAEAWAKAQRACDSI